MRLPGCWKSEYACKNYYCTWLFHGCLCWNESRLWLDLIIFLPPHNPPTREACHVWIGFHILSSYYLPRPGTDKWSMSVTVTKYIFNYLCINCKSTQLPPQQSSSAQGYNQITPIMTGNFRFLLLSCKECAAPIEWRRTQSSVGIAGASSNFILFRRTKNLTKSMRYEGVLGMALQFCKWLKLKSVWHEWHKNSQSFAYILQN